MIRAHLGVSPLVAAKVMAIPVPGPAWGLFLPSHSISPTVVRGGYYCAHF